MKQKSIYILGVLVILVIVSVKFFTNTIPADDVIEQNSVSASWNALSAGSFMFN
jgi:hypothetical protein